MCNVASISADGRYGLIREIRRRKDDSFTVRLKPECSSIWATSIASETCGLMVGSVDGRRLYFVSMVVKVVLIERKWKRLG